MGSRLGTDFYMQDDAVLAAKTLLGKVVVTCCHGRTTAGMIVETEAYQGPEDKASHAYGGRRTKRTEVMFHKGGAAYVYLCYGIHHLFNVVTGPEGVPHAVLVRAIQPVSGIGLMLARRKQKAVRPGMTAGPGVLSAAMGIRTDWSGVDLAAPDSPVWLEDRKFTIFPEQIESGPRIGIDYAGDYRSVHWRFWVRDSAWVSRAR